MKTEAELRARVHEITQDSRFWAPPAELAINAPLAIVQTALSVEIKSLRWALNYSEEFTQGEEGGHQSIRRYGLKYARHVAHGLQGSQDEYSRGFCAVVSDYQYQQES